MDERVAKLEVRVEVINEKLDRMCVGLDAITKDLAKYRGAWGMLLMMGAAISTAVSLWFKLGKH